MAVNCLLVLGTGRAASALIAKPLFSPFLPFLEKILFVFPCVGMFCLLVYIGYTYKPGVLRGQKWALYLY